MLDWSGYDVTLEFYINDAGNQIQKFGKSLAVRYLQQFCGDEVIIRGERFQKCRYNAFLFPICMENNPFLQNIIERELTARTQAEA